MSEIVRFKSEKYGDLLVEVDEELGEDFERVGLREKVGDKIPEAAEEFEKAVDPVLLHAKQVLEKVKDLKLDGAEIEFGIKLTAEAGVLAKIGGEANLNIKLIWESDAE
jgi:hypothetical protein